jgi:hypothetical protein
MSTNRISKQQQINTIRNQVAKTLAELGDSPDAVASSLREQGITGFPRCPFGCPLVMRLLDLDPLWKRLPLTTESLKVDGDHVFVDLWPGKYQAFKVDLLEPCQRFVSRFDDGAYPFLIEA